MDKGHAYPVEGGDVYFSVRSYPDYGKLSGQSVDDLSSGARIEPGEHKRDPLDFALWKAMKPGEPAWDSPWGKGRPGWHIECSAMSMSFGARPRHPRRGPVPDLPHHENESPKRGRHGQALGRYWITTHINVNNSKKSKTPGIS